MDTYIVGLHRITTQESHPYVFLFMTHWVTQVVRLLAPNVLVNVKLKIWTRTARGTKLCFISLFSPWIYYINYFFYYCNKKIKNSCDRKNAMWHSAALHNKIMKSRTEADAMSVWHNKGERFKGEIQEPEDLNEWTLYAGPIKIRRDRMFEVNRVWLDNIYDIWKSYSTSTMCM